MTVARVNLLGLHDQDRSRLGADIVTNPIRLNQDATVRAETITKDTEEPDRILHPVQDPEAEDDVERLPELREFVRVHPSILDLRVEAFRVYLALQEDPDRVEHRQSRLGQEIERCAGHFRRILDDDRVGAFHRRFREEHLGSRRKWLDRLPPVVRRRLEGKVDSALERLEAIRQDDNAVRARISDWIKAFEAAADEAREHSIVVYREPDDERALRAVRTRAVRLEKAA